MRRPLLIIPFLAILLAGCNRNVTPRHPNAVDSLDSATYDSLIVAQAVLDNAKAAVRQGRLPESAKPVINSGGVAYNVLRELWVDYHAKPDASLSEKIIAATLDLNKFILQLRGLGVPQ